MLIKVDENTIDKTDSLVEFLTKDNKPKHRHELKSTYLGLYVEVLKEDLTFKVYDLYYYLGTKFKPPCFIARYGDETSEYSYRNKKELETLPNKFLKTFPEGEAYRRFKRRQPCLYKKS